MLETLKQTSSSSTMGVSSVNGVHDKYKKRKVSATREFPKGCGRFAAATRLNTTKEVLEQPMVSLEQHSKSLDRIELVSAVQTEDIELPSKSMNQQMEESQEQPINSSDEQPVMDFVTESVFLKVADGTETSYLDPIVSENSKPLDQIELKSPNQMNSKSLDPMVMDSVDLKVEDEAETSVMNLGSILKEYPPRRRVSAVRQFPIGWSNVPTFSNESVKGTNADNDDSLSRKFDKEIADSGKQLDEQLLEQVLDSIWNNSHKRKVLGDFENSICAKTQGGRSVITGSSGEKMIVQGLMAAKNCPWRNANGYVKSTPTRQGTTSRQVQNLEIVPYARNSLEYNSGQITYLDDEKDAQEHDDMDEKISSAPRPPRSPLSVSPLGRPASYNDNVVTRSKVRETLRLFQSMFRKLLQEEESKPKESGSLFAKRIDLVTVSEMKKQDKCVNTGNKIIGHVPGVEVGDEFHYRVELSIIGLHGPFQGGIDYVKIDGKKIVATSVVSSGGYDDIDNFDILIYSGQGGNPAGGNKKAEDQKLERGNLAIKNSIDKKTPVRVIRGFKETKGPDSFDTRGKVVVTYTYDGLYLVHRYWQEKGRHGNNIYRFELRRIPGQPELAFREVQKSKKSKVREGLCVDDISQGEEKMRICAVNTLDSEKPPQFKYIAKMKYTSSHNPIPLKGGCECKDGCSDSEKCLCVVKNGGEIPFNHNGAIVEAKTFVYECGPLCKCPPSCHNRVSQRGIKFQLEIFKTKSRGWGVRSLNSIPSGSFICEYTGELLAEKEADQRTGNDEYLFDLGRSKSSNQIIGDGLSNVSSPDLQSTRISCENVEDEGFTIDALEYGSVGRFINHSCSPNLVAQNVLYDHDDKRMPHIMLFAAENIPPLQELTYDYNYVIDTVHDSAGNIKIKECYCGSTECTGRMY